MKMKMKMKIKIKISPKKHKPFSGNGLTKKKSVLN